MVKLIVKSFSLSGRLESVRGLDQINNDVMEASKIVELKKKLGFRSNEDFPSRCGDIHRRTKKLVDHELFRILEDFKFKMVSQSDSEMWTMTTVLELDEKQK